jgi:hypothetical protein
MNTTQANPYQEAARFRKVMLLSDLAKQHSISSSDLALMQDSHWRMLSQAARVNPPGAETRQAVIDALVRAESRPTPVRVFPQ